MGLNHKLGAVFRILSVLILLLVAGSFIILKNSITYADDEKGSEEMCPCPDMEGLEVITIDNKGYKKDRKGPSKFEHIKHTKDYKISCWECHHEFKDDKDTQVAEDTQSSENPQDSEENPNIWSPWGKTKKCMECHDPNEKKDDVIRLQAAYHKNCKECHKEKRIYDNDYLAYRKCTKCHE